MVESNKTSNIKIPDYLLLEEYKGLIPQIVHWDSHFWNKSKFFLTIESAFLVGSLYALKEYLIMNNTIPKSLFLLLLIVVAFNLYLSYVWFRTNRRNREYLELRFQRAREIEEKLGKVMEIFTNDPLKLPRCHRGASWEIHLATCFAAVWIILVGVSVLIKFGYI